jgi:hypothetical protein
VSCALAAAGWAWSGAWTGAATSTATSALALAATSAAVPSATFGPARTARSAAASPATAAAGAPALGDVGGAAPRAYRRRLLALIDPAGITCKAAHAPRLDAVLAAADEDGLATNKGVSDAGAPALEHTPDRLAGHAHGFGRLLVRQALEVDESDGLEFVDSQLQLLEVPRGHTGRLEQRDAWDACDCALNRWAWHASPRWFLAYAQDSRGSAGHQTASARVAGLTSTTGCSGDAGNGNGLKSAGNAAEARVGNSSGAGGSVRR